MTYVRKDFNKKINNSSANVQRRKPVRHIFSPKDYVECDNIFNIDCSQWQENK